MKLSLTLILLVVALLATNACSTGQTCNAGCLCNSVDSCPSGCFVTQPSGGGAKFCSNGIVSCGNGAWSSGTPTNQCGGGSSVATDAGPAGAVCCPSATDSGTDAAQD
jgi:hypothetical protein